MTNRLFKFEIDAPGTADKVKSLEFTPQFKGKNAFRIEKAWIGFTNRDAEATGDKIGFQISTQNQNEAAALYDVDSEYEVFTWQKEENVLGTNGSHQVMNDPSKFIPIETIEGTILKNGKRYYLNSICTGQDGADVTTQVKLLGHPVDIDDHELADWHDNFIGGV